MRNPILGGADLEAENGKIQRPAVNDQTLI
jgi:hypothetical protein